MTQIERLIARVVQLIEDNPTQVISIIIVTDGNGAPVCWQVEQGQAEGLQTPEIVVEFK